jgi:hypothetical protein
MKGLHVNSSLLKSGANLYSQYIYQLPVLRTSANLNIENAKVRKDVGPGGDVGLLTTPNCETHVR